MVTASAFEAEAAALQPTQNEEGSADHSHCGAAHNHYCLSDLHLDEICLFLGEDSHIAARNHRRGRPPWKSRRYKYWRRERVAGIGYLLLSYTGKKFGEQKGDALWSYVGIREANLSLRPLLAVIPARGGSKGLPGKNLRSLSGLPLIAHSILLTKLCPEIDRCIVSTDSEQIAAVARDYGAEVPFLRPAELAEDDTPAWAVLQHAIHEMETLDRKQFASLLLLQPTAPCRLPEDVTRALNMLDGDSAAVGVVAVSEPEFNPRWVCVEQRGGYMKQMFQGSESYTRRQDVPPVYRINGLLYLWRREHVLNAPAPRYNHWPHKMLVVPELRSGDVDTAHDLVMIELLVREGLVQLPWLVPDLEK